MKTYCSVKKAFGEHFFNHETAYGIPRGKLSWSKRDTTVAIKTLKWCEEYDPDQYNRVEYSFTHHNSDEDYYMSGLYDMGDHFELYDNVYTIIDVICANPFTFFTFVGFDDVYDFESQFNIIGTTIYNKRFKEKLYGIEFDSEVDANIYKDDDENIIGISILDDKENEIKFPDYVMNILDEHFHRKYNPDKGEWKFYLNPCGVLIISPSNLNRLVDYTDDLVNYKHYERYNTSEIAKSNIQKLYPILYGLQLGYNIARNNYSRINIEHLQTKLF